MNQLGWIKSRRLIVSLFDLLGIRSFFALEGEEVNVVASSLGSPVSMNSTTDLIKKISDRLTDVVPVERLVERRKWRDDRLAALARLRKTLEHSWSPVLPFSLLHHLHLFGIWTICSLNAYAKPQTLNSFHANLLLIT